MLTIRNVKPSDSSNILLLSNDPEIRAVSFNSTHISQKEHSKWFQDKLADKNCVFFIIEFNHIFAGQVRFYIEKDSAKISLSLDKHYQGKGNGSLALGESLKLLKFTHPNIKLVVALVKKDNVISNKFFKRNNFKLVNQEEENRHKILKYIYEY